MAGLTSFTITALLLTSPAGRNTLLDEIRMRMQADFEPALSAKTSNGTA